MWKGRPVVASAIGGIQDQIVDGRTGLLVRDPHDLAEFGDRVLRVLEDQALADAIGRAAREEVRDSFLAPRHLLQYVDLLERLLSA
jgi:trehalose synthase